MAVLFAARWWAILALCWAFFESTAALSLPFTPAHEQLSNNLGAPDLQGQSLEIRDPTQGKAHPRRINGGIHAQDRRRTRHVQTMQLEPRAAPVAMRILCLGASIMGGDVASDHNGMRYNLRSALVADGHAVNMVGSRNIGSMGDNQVEGWGGYRIDQVSEKANLSLPSLPNVVCILCGNNDVYQNFNTSGMSDRMGQLIDKVLNWVPDTTIIVSTLMPNNIPADDAINKIYNANLTDVVASRANAGQKVFLVNCSSTWWSMADEIPSNHPTDGGYIKMARVFYDGIKLAMPGITPPNTPVGGIDDSSPPDVLGGNKCDKDPANENGPIVTELTTGSNNGAYAHSQKLSATVYDMTKLGGGGTSTALFWADVRLDDYVNVHADMKQLTIAFSKGAGQFGAGFTVDVSNVACASANVQFADIGGDGRADLCCITPAGAISCATNKYASGVAKPFSKLVAIAATYNGFPGSRNRLADIDGDGRADRVIVHDNGDLEGFRNAGTGSTVTWQYLGSISTGKTFSDVDGIRLIDINGDGRADILWMDTTGKVTTWINQRGLAAGSLAPSWMASVVTHPSLTVAKPRPLITFGKIFGTTRNDPIRGTIKSDMVLATNTAGKATKFQIYENKGSGGTRVNGDGAYFCDMRGTGSDDYLWVTIDGNVLMYGNKQQFTQPPQWTSYGYIFYGARNRRDIHIADLDGDGRCDILLVDKATGAVTMQRNDYNATSNKFVFTNIGVVSAGATCTQGYGTGLTDLGIRFADITGNRFADLLCIAPDGSTSAFLNNGLNNFSSAGLIHSAPGLERADIRFADVNGDGRADFLVVDKYSGAVNASINDNSTGAGVITWIDKGVVSAGGRARGGSVDFANLNATGRADYVVIDPATAVQNTWFNFCPNSASPLRAAPLPLPLDPSNPLSS